MAGGPTLQDEHPREVSEPSPRPQPGRGGGERRRGERELADDRGGRSSQTRGLRIGIQVRRRPPHRGQHLPSALERSHVGDRREQPQVALDRAEPRGGLEHAGASLFRRAPTSSTAERPARRDRSRGPGLRAPEHGPRRDQRVDLRGPEDPLSSHLPDPGHASPFDLPEVQELRLLQEAMQQVPPTELEGQMAHASVADRALRGQPDSSAARSSAATAASFAPRRSARPAADSSSAAISSSVPRIDAARCHARRSCCRRARSPGRREQLADPRRWRPVRSPSGRVDDGSEHRSRRGRSVPRPRRARASAPPPPRRRSWPKRRGSRRRRRSRSARSRGAGSGDSWKVLRAG